MSTTTHTPRPAAPPDHSATDDDRSVPDPWYGDSDGFAEVFAIVERTANTLVETLRRDPQEAVLGTESS